MAVRANHRGQAMRTIVRSLLLAMIAVGLAFSVVRASDVFSIFDAIDQAVRTNPGVGEAAANRRATEAELRQNQSTLLPQVRLEARAGPERFNQSILPPPGNGNWLHGSEGSVVVRQLLFDGFATINQIWRQAARVDAAAARVLERTELIALDAVEAYVDVTRYTRLLALAQVNLDSHRKIMSNVQARFSGGRAGEGDNQLVRERVAAAEAIYADFRLSLENARAKYRKTIGLEPYSLRFPSRLANLPKTKDESLAIALQFNPTIRAADADKLAAKYGFHATAGSFLPTVTLEGRAKSGRDSDGILGDRREESGKLVLSWDIFRGGQDSWARYEAAERWAEQSARHARLQREAFEALDKAWAARTITSDRAAALVRQVDAANKVIASYTKEYEIGQRTLIDVLDSNNQYFNAQVSLISIRGVAVFADYQLLAAMGQLLEYLKAPQPVEADPIDSRPFALLFPTKLPPVLFRLPEPGSEPLNADAPATAPMGPYVVTLSGRSSYWRSADGSSVAEQQRTAAATQSDSKQLFTSGWEAASWGSSALAFSPGDQMQVPWSIKPNPGN
jgi:adhesin transport system outer membrane protein